MRSPYEDFAVGSVTDNEDTKNSAKNIPYHARENSLPFSYGQIGKTSTPLRKVNAGISASDKPYGSDFNFNINNNNNNNIIGAASSERDFGYKSTTDGNYKLNSEYNFENYNKTKSVNLLPGSESDTEMIKSQPRLTSPLLVRKTLNSSRSPTRGSTTNTISNTYHYNYGLNGTANNYNNYNNNNNSISNNSNTISGGILRKTPTRNDFEELLRERREKVYNEYRSTTQRDLSASRQTMPAPGERYLNGNKQQSNQGKYNFDFEFNLNLDDMPRRANTVERSSMKYYTRDIPIEREPTMAPSSYVERNYHTISSTNANRERPPLEAASSSSTTTTSTSYTNRIQQLQQQQQQQQQLQQQQRPDYVAPYGNGNLSGYGSNNYNEYGNRTGTLGAAHVRSRRDLSSPIYATSTKQVTRSNSLTAYRNLNPTTITNEPELSVTDSVTTTSNLVSPSATLVSRPETPAFPVTPRTPYGANSGYNSPISKRPEFTNGHSPEVQNYTAESIYQTNQRPRLNSNLSVTNSEPQEVAAHLVKFAKDSSKFWYKPNLSREEAISLLLNATPGTFVIRDSTTYKNAYGLVLRVAQPPPGSATGKQDELVRHFLIEPTTRGVRLKGCANEPVFTSLSALVYEHSINKLALPCLLRIPERDLVPPLLEPTPAQKHLLTQGAACNVLWLFSCETESLTGEEAIRKAIRQLYAQKPLPIPTEVHFKVSQQGITLTDNTRKKFFRKHYTSDIISFCAIDPDHRLWTMQETTNDEDGKNTTVVGALKKTIFAFVARRSPSSKDNQCHVFCDLAINQPASAIVSFVNKTLPTEKQKNYVL